MTIITYDQKNCPVGRINNCSRYSSENPRTSQGLLNRVKGTTRPTVRSPAAVHRQAIVTASDTIWVLQHKVRTRPLKTTQSALREHVRTKHQASRKISTAQKPNRGTKQNTAVVQANAGWGDYPSAYQHQRTPAYQTESCPGSTGCADTQR